MAAEQLVSPIFAQNWFCWLELQSAPSKCPVIHPFCHSIIILWVSEGRRREILSLFCLFLLGFIWFLPLSSGLLCVFIVTSKWPPPPCTPKTHILPLVLERGLLYVFSRHSSNTCRVEYFSAKTEHIVNFSLKLLCWRSYEFLER